MLKKDYTAISNESNNISRNNVAAYNVEFGKRMKNARQMHGLSQDHVAEAINTSFQQIQRNEKGTSILGAYSIHQLKQLYGVTYDYLFGESDSYNGQAPIVNTDDNDLLHIARISKQILAISDINIRSSLLKLISELSKQ